MSMGVISCTGLKEGKELQTVMLVINEGELTGKSSTLAAPQDSISGKTLTLGRIQTHSFLYSLPLLNTPKTGERMNQLSRDSWGGAYIHTVIGIHQIKKYTKVASATRHKKMNIQSQYAGGSNIMSAH